MLTRPAASAASAISMASAVVEGERLLAEDRLAGGDELHRGRVVDAVGGELTAASNSPQAIASSRLPKAFGMRGLAAKSRARSAFVSTAATSSQPGISGELLGVARGPWRRCRG